MLYKIIPEGSKMYRFFYICVIVCFVSCTTTIKSDKKEQTLHTQKIVQTVAISPEIRQFLMFKQHNEKTIVEWFFTPLKNDPNKIIYYICFSPNFSMEEILKEEKLILDTISKYSKVEFTVKLKKAWNEQRTLTIPIGWRGSEQQKKFGKKIRTLCSYFETTYDEVMDMDYGIIDTDDNTRVIFSLFFRVNYDTNKEKINELSKEYNKKFDEVLKGFELK